MIADINQFEIADTDRENVAWLLEQNKEMKRDIALLKDIVMMLAQAEQFRIKKHVDKL